MHANIPTPLVSAGLAGVRIAVTRLDGGGGPLAAALRAAGASVTEFAPTRTESLDPAPLAQAVQRLDRYQWVLLTSVNAVRQLAAALSASRASLGLLRLAVVGSATTDAVESMGWQVTLIPESSQPGALVDAMAERSDVEGARVLYPAAEGTRDILPAGLQALGATVDVVPVYRTIPDSDAHVGFREMVRDGALDLVTVATPSAVDALLAALPAEHARRLPVACIGPVTARAARTAGFPVKVASESASIPALVRSIIAAFTPPI